MVYVAAWLAAGIAAVVLASTGVSMVGRQVTADRPPPLSADEIRTELAAGAGPTTTAGAAGRTTSVSPTATSVVSGDGSGPAAGGADDSEPPPARTTTPSGAAPPPAGAPATTVPPAATETRSYTLIGGSATLRFSSSGVTVVSATPNAGFAVETESTHDTGVRVRFRSDSHESEVEGWWDGGPRDEVAEEE